MKTEKGLKIFEKIKLTDESGDEYWRARELAKILEYSQYRHFLPVIEKAKESCENTKNKASDHFEDVLGMIELAKGVVREVGDIKLSRYACYLIVQNANPAKEVVAMGQTYFAVQTRLQEIQQSAKYQNLKSEEEKRLFLRSEFILCNIQLASAAKEAELVTSIDY